MSVDSVPTEAAPVKEPGGDGTPEAGLVVDEVRVRGFRSLVGVKVRLEPTNTYLVGENNSGKSSLLLAIATACGNRRATIEDLHQGPDGQTVEEGEINLLVRSRGNEFQEAVGQRLGPNAAPGPGRGEWTGIRTTLRSSQEGPFLHTRRTFLQWDPAGQDWIDTRNGVPEKVLELMTSQLLDASRDLEAEIPNRTSDWGKVLTNLAVEDDDRRKLEGDLLTLGEELHQASPVFGTLRTQLSKVAEAQAGVDEVTLQALPVRLEELAKAVEVMVASGGRKGMPLRYQGLGSRSLAALMVFQALCHLRVGADLGIRPHILTLLEEPEAHLHPQAQAGIARILRALPGQAIVATHSPVIVAEADPGAVRIFRADDPGAVVNALSRKSAKKIAVFRRYVERPLGELFFARLVVFVDGTAERISLPSC
jgi:putative ATP-dependent endonuclease of the OLD family